MRKVILVFLLASTSIGSASVMESYRLVWDTGKIASFISLDELKTCR